MLIAGSLAGTTSPARTDTPLVGADLTLHGDRAVVPADPAFEYAVIPLDGRVSIGPEVVEPGWLALVPAGFDELPLIAHARRTRLLLLGGQPLGERVEMWWNFVARSRAEIEQAWRDWRDHTDRIGAVTSTLERIEAPRPPGVPARH